jgi:putative endonuclease
MYYLYVLKSKRDDELYFGYTSDLRKRLTQHNSRLVEATRTRRPFVLVYYEAYLSKDDAKHREFSIKLRGNAYLQLKRRIKNCVAEGE